MTTGGADSGAHVIALCRPNGNGARAGFDWYGIFGQEDVRVVGTVKVQVNELGGRPRAVQELWVQITKVSTQSGTMKREAVVKQLLWRAEEGSPRGCLMSGKKEVEFPFGLLLPLEEQALSFMKDLTTGKEASFTWRIEAYTVLAGKDHSRPEASAICPLEFRLLGNTPLLDRSFEYLEWSSTSVPEPLSFSYNLRLPNAAWSHTAPLEAALHFRLPPSKHFRLDSTKLTLRRKIIPLDGRIKTVVQDYDLKLSGLQSLSLDEEYYPQGGPRLSNGTAPVLPIQADSEPTMHHMLVRAELQKTRYAVGETLETDATRIEFELGGEFGYHDVANRKKTHKLPFRAVHVNGAVSGDTLGPNCLTQLGQKMPDAFARRFWPNLVGTLCASSSRPPSVSSSTSKPTSPSSSHARRANALLPLPSPGRPQSGRRMSEQADEPARTKMRRDPPSPIRLPDLVQSASSSPAPSFGSSAAISRSSTVETLGPDTPCTLDFAMNSSSSRPPSSSKPQHPTPLSSSISSSHRHPPRSSRASHRSNRPRSSGSAVSNFSIVSVTSASSTTAKDSGSTRELSPVSYGLPSTPTYGPLTDELPTLSLRDSSFSSQHHLFASSAASVAEDDVVMATAPPPPHKPTPSPPSSPDPSFNNLIPSPFSQTFRDPFSSLAGASSSSPALAITPPDRASAPRPSRPRIFCLNTGQESRVSYFDVMAGLAAAAPQDIYVSPRQASSAPAIMPTETGSPKKISSSSSKQPVVTFSNTASPPLPSQALPQPPRKGSFIHNFIRKMSKV
ncbi:hypothetical protein JCM8547_007252 [Rhodosporidiobolus lusitaniae]